MGICVDFLVTVGSVMMKTVSRSDSGERKRERSGRVGVLCCSQSSLIQGRFQLQVDTNGENDTTPSRDLRMIR